LLRKIVGVLPQDRQFAITVFGSAPLQICVDSSLTSAEVNVFSDFEELRELVDRTDSARTKPSSTFSFKRTEFPHQPTRKGARNPAHRQLHVHFPAPIDILIAS